MKLNNSPTFNKSLEKKYKEKQILHDVLFNDFFSFQMKFQKIINLLVINNQGIRKN